MTPSVSLGQRLVARGARGLASLLVSVLAIGAPTVVSATVPATPTSASVARAVVPITTAATTATIPRTTRATGTIADWKVASTDVLAEVAPEVGHSKDGVIALGIDAPVVKTATAAAWIDVAVEPNTAYAFSAYARVLSPTLKSTGAAFMLGTTAVAAPKLNAKWVPVTSTYTTGAEETSLRVAVRVSKAVRGLSVDNIVLAPVDGPSAGVNIVSNPSFESVRPGVKRGIVSSSLIVATKTAAVAVAMPAGKITWEALRGSKRVARVSVASQRPITALPLKGVSQGLYTLKVTGSDGRTVKTTIAVVDSPNPWIYQDARYGVALHVERELYADAGRHARALGYSQARNNVRWSMNEKKKGVYDFSAYQAPFDRLSANGIKLLGIVNSGNSLYGKANLPPQTSTAIAAYGRYAAAIAKRFNLVGLEVYNEYNHKPFNASKCRSGKCYFPLLKSVSKAVEKVKPSLPIIAGATARYDSKFFQELWKAGGIKYADAVSFHPYEITGMPDDLAGIVKTARANMKKYGKTTKPVWISELGTSSRTGNRTTKEQATVLVRSSVTAFANGVKRFYWYDLINDTPRRADHEGNFGLYSHPVSTVTALAPKDAAFAQALTVTQLGGRGFRATEKRGTGVVSHAFGSTSDTVRVVWAPKSSKTVKLKTSKPVVLVAFDGTKKTLKPKRGVVSFTATKTPVFIRSGKAVAGVTK